MKKFLVRDLAVILENNVLCWSAAGLHSRVELAIALSIYDNTRSRQQSARSVGRLS